MAPAQFPLKPPKAGGIHYQSMAKSVSRWNSRPRGLKPKIAWVSFGVPFQSRLSAGGSGDLSNTWDSLRLAEPFDAPMADEAGSSFFSSVGAPFLVCFKGKQQFKGKPEKEASWRGQLF